MLRTALFLLAIVWLSLYSGPAALAADTVYQSPTEFLAEYLPGCTQQALWLDEEVKTQIEKLVEHPFPGVRVRYCAKDGKTAWILDEVGKTEPITSGIVVDNETVERVRVLIFRESRGSEVSRDAFTRQYQGAALDRKDALDQSIDGISGATLSVWAVGRQVRLALFLDRLVRSNSHSD